MRLWRISNHADLAGAGGMRAGGRWHSAGHPIVYCGTSPAACLLEALVHVSVRGPDDLPPHYQLLAFDLPDDVALVERLDRAYLRSNKKAERLALLHATETPAPRCQLAIGSLLAEERRSLLIRVRNPRVAEPTTVPLAPLTSPVPADVRSPME